MKNKRDLISTGREWAILFQLATKALEDLTDKEIDQLLKNQGRLKFVEQDVVEQQPPAIDRIPDDELQALADQFQKSDTSDKALEMLQTDHRVQRKDDLIRFARLFSVNINPRDKRDAIEEKIVRNVIGARLRSEAIQSLSLRGGV